MNVKECVFSSVSESMSVSVCLPSCLSVPACPHTKVSTPSVSAPLSTHLLLVPHQVQLPWLLRSHILVHPPTWLFYVVLGVVGDQFVVGRGVSWSGGRG